MKYVVLVGDGMADRPVKALGNKTPLEVAKKTSLDYLAANGTIGLVKTIPGYMAPGSAVANLSILGYDPQRYYTGRGPLEAVNLGIGLGKGNIAFRCNLVTVKNGRLLDYSAGHISVRESKALIEEIDNNLGLDGISFFSGVSYRNIMLAARRPPAEIKQLLGLKCYPPHDVMGRPLSRILPKGRGSALLRSLMERSRGILSRHSVNRRRAKKGKNPANMIWLWGGGGKPAMPSFFRRYALRGAVISAVDVIKGIGRILGMDVIDVPGATGYFDTNYEGKARYALRALEKKDFVFVHVESIDEAGHLGDARLKIKAIEDFDKKVVGTIIRGMKKFRDYKILALPDHPTPLSVRTHTRAAVPFVIYQKGKTSSQGVASGFSERNARKSRLHLKKGHGLMKFFLEK